MPATPGQETRSSRPRLDGLMARLRSVYAMPVWQRLAVGAIAAVLGASWRYSVMEILGERVAYLTFYPVVAIAASIGGFVSGVSAAIASALFAHSWFTPLSAAGDWLGLAMFMVSSAFISGMAEMLHRAWSRADRAEKERAEAERLNLVRNERLIAMSGMAIALAHELNQPLSATVLYLKALRRLISRLPENARPARMNDALEGACDQILRAGQIISHLRQFVGRGEPDKIFCSLHRLIREASELVAPAMKDAGVTVALELNAANENVLLDDVQITQVLLNLMRNAREAMSASAMRNLTISTSNDEDNVRIDVADTGSGLSPEMRNRLFEPFMTTKPSGMGVGLSISRSIIEAHYGRIWADSNPEGGATFHVSLPVSAQ